MALSDQRVGEFLAALGAKTPAPASGSATALTAALAAALVELVARFGGADETAGRANELAARLTQLADEDSAAYTAFMENRTGETRRGIIAVPKEIAALADEVAQLAAAVREEVSPSVAGDADAAVELAHAASRIAHQLIALNEGSASRER